MNTNITGLMRFSKIFRPCALDKSSLSTEIVRIEVYSSDMLIGVSERVQLVTNRSQPHHVDLQ